MIYVKIPFLTILEEKPSKEEIDCVMEFYWKHVHEKREETQETITI